MQLSLICSLIAANLLVQAPRVRSVREVERLLAAGASQQQAESIARYLREYRRNADLKRGLLEPPVDKKRILWCIEAAPTAKATVRTKSGESWQLKPLGSTGLHVLVAETPPIVRYDFQYHIDGQSRGGGRVDIEAYDLGPDSRPQDGVPKGKLEEMPRLESKSQYPGLVHQWWVYIPAEYKPDGPPPALMVFQDGGAYINGEGAVPVVFDNLIHKKKMPSCIGVFINPGRRENDRGRSPRTRGDQYDVCTPRYAEFLEKEVLPVVSQKYRFTSDPDQRAIAGASSGASCAFTAAWHRPDLFRRVLSQIGSYCDFRNLQRYPDPTASNTLSPTDLGAWKVAHSYPGLIRKTRPIKPLRVFLQDGERDLDNQLGNWPLANRQMAKALEYSGYKYKFVMGEGFHNHKHGRAILPESLTWLWADD